MKPSLKTRKPVDRLRVVDLEAYPIWEFATDEEDDEDKDETWVRPVKAKGIRLDAYSLSVFAKFTTPSGVELKGIVGVNTAEVFEAVHAAVVTEDDYIFIPWPSMPGAHRLARDAAKELGLKAEDLFPLTYRLAALVDGEADLREGVYSYEKSDA
jgi:hypothetical protein